MFRATANMSAFFLCCFPIFSCLSIKCVGHSWAELYPAGKGLDYFTTKGHKVRRKEPIAGVEGLRCFRLLQMARDKLSASSVTVAWSHGKSFGCHYEHSGRTRQASKAWSRFLLLLYMQVMKELSQQQSPSDNLLCSEQSKTIPQFKNVKSTL